ncbi:hypothetical protein Btru_045536 [Bulinus truncatus]|nr:hypothetical protein Btru_045536 [Bulinus truncatus]
MCFTPISFLHTCPGAGSWVSRKREAYTCFSLTELIAMTPAFIFLLLMTLVFTNYGLIEDTGIEYRLDRLKRSCKAVGKKCTRESHCCGAPTCLYNETRRHRVCTKTKKSKN